MITVKITDIISICLRYPYEHPIMDGCNTCMRREAFLIQIKTDGGIDGLGEAATFGLPLRAFRVVVEEVMKPLLLGQDPANIDYLWERLLWCSYAGGRKGIVRAVASAVDIALWDIKGKVCGMPIYRLLGGKADRVGAYASAGFYASDKDMNGLRREFEDYLRRGYRAFKMKVGRTRENECRIVQYMPTRDAVITEQEDLDRVRTVREVIGREAPLMLDMNNTWGMGTTLRMANFLRGMNIYAIEEPICMVCRKEYQEMAGAIAPVLRAGGENEQGLERYRQIVDDNMLDLIQTNLGWSGGITEAKQIAEICIHAGKLFAPHTFFSAVLTAANVQLAAALPNVPFIESEENPNPLRDDLLAVPLERDEEMAYLLTDRPGLGIELNWNTVEQYYI